MPIAGVPEAEVESNIALVEETFGAPWLQQQRGYHQLQRLCNGGTRWPRSN
jgi:hypothetical protein